MIVNFNFQLGTLEEEEALPVDDNDDELNMLQQESEMSLEELRRRYGITTEETSNLQVTSTSSSRINSSSRRGIGISEARRVVVTNFADSTEFAASSSTYGTYFTEEVLRDDEPDEDYQPPEPWKRCIRVGKMYQV